MSIIGGPGRGPVTGDTSPYVGGTNEPEGVCRVFISKAPRSSPLRGWLTSVRQKGGLPGQAVVTVASESVASESVASESALAAGPSAIVLHNVENNISLPGNEYSGGDL